MILIRGMVLKEPWIARCRIKGGMSWLTVFRMVRVKGGFRSPEDLRKTRKDSNYDALRTCPLLVTIPAKDVSVIEAQPVEAKPSRPFFAQLAMCKVGKPGEPAPTQPPPEWAL
jgi:hypothetical protein